MNIKALPVVCWSVGALLGQSCSAPQEQRPNIIFIMTDDHAYQAISAYGGPLKDLAPTPNIDRIASEGMIFNRCLVTNSICGPSRATILTGKYGHLNGFRSNDQTEFDGEQQTFPKLLQNAGYETAVIGKWHLGSTPTGFHHWDILPDQGHYYNPDFINENGQYREQGYVTDIITQKSIQWIEEATLKNKPFMLMLHHKAPHREWEPGPKYLNRFSGVEFPQPGTLFDNYDGRGSAAKQQDMSIAGAMRIEADLKMWKDTASPVWAKTYGRMDMDQRRQWDAVYKPIQEEFKKTNPQGADLVDWKYQRYMNDYLACIQSVDESVGNVLNFLKEKGLDKNTIVVYTSDQGFYLGEHGWFDKRFMYEESYRTPLLIKWSGKIKPGSANNDIVSNLDFAETFLDAAGTEIPDDMQGQSLVPILKGKTPYDWRTVHYYHYYAYPDYHMVKRHYGISTNRFKLIHFYYDIDEWELYDLEADPREMKNVYGDPDYAAIRLEMHQKLDDARKKYHDTDELTKQFLPQKDINIHQYLLR